jgi:hypothetical protein
MHGFHVRSSTLNGFLQLQNISISALQIALPLLFSKRLMPRKTAVTAPQTLVTRSSINFEELCDFSIPTGTRCAKKVAYVACQHMSAHLCSDSSVVQVQTETELQDPLASSNGLYRHHTQAFSINLHQFARLGQTSSLKLVSESPVHNSWCLDGSVGEGIRKTETGSAWQRCVWVYKHMSRLLQVRSVYL